MNQTYLLDNYRGNNKQWIKHTFKLIISREQLKRQWIKQSCNPIISREQLNKQWIKQALKLIISREQLNTGENYLVLEYQYTWLTYFFKIISLR